jgi:hypothetical protein
MKKLFIISIITFALTAHLSAQLKSDSVSTVKKASLTLGVLQGGGSIVGADFEALLTDRVGVQIGAGFIGYGAGLNYHLKPGINTSYISLAYWHQGSGASYTQSMLGPTFVYRAKKIFTAQIGLGFVLGRGPAYPSNLAQTPVILLYSIGVYFPL